MHDCYVFSEDRHRRAVIRILKILRRGSPFVSILVERHLERINAPEEASPTRDSNWVVIPNGHQIRMLIALGKARAMQVNDRSAPHPSPIRGALDH